MEDAYGEGKGEGKKLDGKRATFGPDQPLLFPALHRKGLSRGSYRCSLHR